MTAPTSEKDSVHVRVPATTANLGPGFDCMGMAVDLWNELIVTKSDTFEMTIEGEGEDALPRDRTNLVVVGLEKAFEFAGKPVPTCKYHLINRIPFARGLGSSSAAIVAGLCAGFVLAECEVKVQGKETLLNMAADLEGHPDNSAPCVYGGIQLGLYDEEEKRWSTYRVPMPSGMQLVIFVPDVKSETAVTRKLIKDTIPRKDAIFNMSRTALMDRMHQPPRATAYPALYPVINAALEAGAHGAFLSGAGSSIMAITSGRKGDTFAQDRSERRDQAVGEAMMKAAKEHGLTGRVYVTIPTEVGARVVRSPILIQG